MGIQEIGSWSALERGTRLTKVAQQRVLLHLLTKTTVKTAFVRAECVALPVQ